MSEIDVEPTGAQPRGSRHLPGLAMMRSYKASWLRFDLVAGIVLAAILVPQGLAYATIAGAGARRTAGRRP